MYKITGDVSSHHCPPFIWYLWRIGHDSASRGRTLQASVHTLGNAASLTWEQRLMRGIQSWPNPTDGEGEFKWCHIKCSFQRRGGRGLTGELPRIPVQTERAREWSFGNLVHYYWCIIKALMDMLKYYKFCHNVPPPVPAIALGVDKEIREQCGHCLVSKEPPSAWCLFDCDWHVVTLWNSVWVLPCYASLGATVSIYK